MSADTWEALFIPLKNDEGELVVLIQQWKEPNKTETKLIKLDSEPTITHGRYPFCMGLMRFVNVSETKKVLRCERCGLRISFPSSVETLGELKEHLLNT